MKRKKERREWWLDRSEADDAEVPRSRRYDADPLDIDEIEPETECVACGHVHKDPEDRTRKCWAVVPRRVGKLGVRSRLGRCRCRGGGDEEDGAPGRQPKDVDCRDCGVKVDTTKGLMTRCKICSTAHLARQKREKNRRYAAIRSKERAAVMQVCVHCGAKRLREKDTKLRFLCFPVCEALRREDLMFQRRFRCTRIAEPWPRLCFACQRPVPVDLLRRSNGRAVYCGEDCRGAFLSAQRRWLSR